MLALLLLPAGLQALAMAADEWICHRKRGLPRWERIGHPLDTLSVAVGYGWLLVVPHNHPHGLAIYIGLAALSCLVITKDEPVHAKLCDVYESWLHAVLFVLHPVVFMALALIWLSDRDSPVIVFQFAITVAFGIYQFVYWNVLWKPNCSTILQ